MLLPTHLVTAIESSHVAFEGLSHPLRLVSADRVESPLGGGVEITVAASHEGRTVHYVRRFEAAELDDEKRITAMLADGLRAELGASRA